MDSTKIVRFRKNASRDNHPLGEVVEFPPYYARPDLSQQLQSSQGRPDGLNGLRWQTEGGKSAAPVEAIEHRLRDDCPVHLEIAGVSEPSLFDRAWRYLSEHIPAFIFGAVTGLLAVAIPAILIAEFGL